MSELVDRAGASVRDVHSHFDHLDRTLTWVVEPGAHDGLGVPVVVDVIPEREQVFVGWRDGARVVGHVSGVPSTGAHVLSLRAELCA